MGYGAKLSNFNELKPILSVNIDMNMPARKSDAINSIASKCQRWRPRWLMLRVVWTLTLSAAVGAAFGVEDIRKGYFREAPNVPPVVPMESIKIPIEEMHPARQSIEKNRIYDETNPALVQLQQIDEATHDLKKDPLGFPDWMAAIRSGAITPRAGLSDNAKMNVLDLDVVMKNTKGMPYVLFPHQSHTMWLACSNCHPAPFAEKAGSTPITMGSIFEGNYCGMCHDRIAFITFFSCTRCHKVPQDAPPHGK
jgi:c(7)-type cytochrome triheme protein